MHQLSSAPLARITPVKKSATNQSPQENLPVQDNLLIVGKFGKVFGIKGWITVHSFTQPAENLIEYRPWMIEQECAWTPIEINACKPYKSKLIAQVNNVADREQLSRLTGCDIAISHAALPNLADGEYYWHDLIGMQVLTVAGIRCGTVSRLMDTNANHILVVTDPTDKKKEHLIPWLPEQGVIQEVSLTERRITIDWGLD